MAYTKRFAGGFVDKPTLTTPIDSTFLNAVETALLKLFDTDPTADGQVQSWVAASTKFGPALLLNKNVDPAAAIAKSKLDFTGANGIVNADVAGAAAIARSKLDFGSGLVNADISSSAAIAISKIANALKVTVGTIASGPPGSPATNDIWVATDVDANGTVWCFRYNSAEATYKWEFIGGPPASAVVDASETTTSATYVDMATGGPSITLARAGDYQISFGAQVIHPARIQASYMSFAVGGTGALDTDAIVTNQFDAATPRSSSAQARTRPKVAIPASSAITAKYKSDGTGTGDWANRWMTIVPVRVI